jgi:ABC-type multidrug transport system ATPase subunit
LIPQLDAACRAADHLAEATEHAIAQHPDAPVLTSFPDIGSPTGARILAEIGDDRSYFAAARRLRACAAAVRISRASNRTLMRMHVDRSVQSCAGDAGEQHAIPDTGCLTARLVGLMERRRQLLSCISFSAHPGSLTAIIGPSGAGKSTLAKVIAGIITPTTGRVTFDGRDIHAEYSSLRCRIGLVPQDDVVHHRLTLADALRYAAELRLSRASKKERRRAIAKVLRELELTDHVHTRIDKLSGGQRKRVSVAMELLTSPSLLILDEPTSGLDPALDRQVMMMLRRLADAGRVVLVVTHCLTYLDVCDQLVLLAPQGKPAYCGPPNEIAATMGTTDWADIFTRVRADPDAACRDFLARLVDQPGVVEPLEDDVMAAARAVEDLSRAVRSHTEPPELLVS